MKLVLCFLFSLYASLDFWWYRPSSSYPLVFLILSTAASQIGYQLSYNLPMLWYTPDEITKIVLLFLMLYHLHPKTRKFAFLKETRNIPASFFIPFNDFGFGILAGLQKSSSLMLMFFTLCFHLCFLFFPPAKFIYRKWFSLVLIVLMILFI